MENELLNLVTEALDEMNVRYLCAEGGRIIVRFNNDDSVCIYRATKSGLIFRTFYDLGSKVAEEKRGNVLECVNSINSSFLEGVLCIDEDGGIVYSVYMEYAGRGSITKQRIIRVLEIALETEKKYFEDIKHVIYGGSFERGRGAGAGTTENSDAIENFSEFLSECSDDTFMAYYKKDLNRIREMLYGEDVPDSEVLWQVYEGEKLYQQEGHIANYVIMGGPGSGKTTLAKKLADYVDMMLADEKRAGKNRLMVRSVADLKGAHVGQTGNRVYDLLKEASLNKKIIFIDEAYQLLSDEFGMEALSVLLPVMSGDRDEIEKVVKQEKEVFSFSKHGQWVPPIWFGGYEDETRNMMNQNAGLYRRASMISLSEPGVEDLYQCLRKLCKENGVLKDVINHSENQKVIKGYFDWGMQPERIAYFACYAGVEALYRKLNVYLSEELSEEQKRTMLSKVIRDSMKEIERQCSATGRKN